MTNAELQKLENRLHTLEKRMVSLQQLAYAQPVMDAMAEYTEEIVQLRKAITEQREYEYNFIGGGWNTEIARTMEDAITQAKARWIDSPGLQVNEKTFRVVNEN